MWILEDQYVIFFITKINHVAIIKSKNCIRGNHFHKNH